MKMINEKNLLYNESDIVLPVFNLQFFAEGQGGEKTEPASQKKLDDARKEGQVAKSKEVATGLGLLSLFLLLKFWVGILGTQFLELFGGVYNRIPELATLNELSNSTLDIIAIMRQVWLQLIIYIAPVFAVGFIVSFIADYVQVQWKPTAKPLKPKFSKLNPLNGFKRIFSANTLFELVKSIAKILLIAYITYSYLLDRKNQLLLLYDIPLMPALSLIGKTVIDLGIRISIVYLVIVVADFAYQKFKFAKDMRMTKQEVKEEFKNQEGNPEIKGRIRQKMREVSQRRMMQSLPQADVVITNPTHYAVAVKYDPDSAEAPIVIAKGADYLALKIKEIAKENKIELVENKPLARMLYANVDVGAEVPPELYGAVAEVLAYVYHLQGKI